ncbi:hypothetical protein [Serratia quinivorans]|uniref:hypothetical protein n=1 Tax=Serratia quinivorans TaxID=137545 RepID=UPI003981E585
MKNTLKKIPDLKNDLLKAIKGEVYKTNVQNNGLGEISYRSHITSDQYLKKHNLATQHYVEGSKSYSEPIKTITANADGMNFKSLINKIIDSKDSDSRTSADKLTSRGNSLLRAIESHQASHDNQKIKVDKLTVELDKLTTKSNNLTVELKNLT